MKEAEEEVDAAACDGRCSWVALLRARPATSCRPPSTLWSALFRSVWTSGMPRPVPGGRGAADPAETRVVVGEPISPQGQRPQLPTSAE